MLSLSNFLLERVVLDKTPLSKRISKIRHLDKLDALGLTSNECIIMASAACILHGMPIENQDIDISISKSALKRIKNKLLPGEKDEVHDNMYTDKSGVIDINVGLDWGEDFKFDKIKNMTIIVGPYRFLSVKGLKYFYKTLYDKYHKEKHKIRLDWLNNKY